VASLSEILTSIRQRLDRKEELREQVLPLARQLIRESAALIKNAHRKEWDEAQNRRKVLLEAVSELKVKLTEAPDLWFAGFVQDALKEVAEACIVYALLRNEPVPSPEDLGIDDAPYLNGLLEAMGELRRATLDAIRSEDLSTAEKFLAIMDEVYFEAMTFDQADAITQGARRRTDALRAILERTRSDITLAYQYRKLSNLLPTLGEVTENENELLP
jgi:Predicted RNA-binding protein of the translin family